MGKDKCCEKYKKKGNCCKGCPLASADDGGKDKSKKKGKKKDKDKGKGKKKK